MFSFNPVFYCALQDRTAGVRVALIDDVPYPCCSSSLVWRVRCLDCVQYDGYSIFLFDVLRQNNFDSNETKAVS